jgi:hypothetical protein
MRWGTPTMSTADLSPMLEYAAVKTWLEDLRQQWGTDPLQDDPGCLQAVERFCRFVDKDPDAMIRECFIRKEGQKKISYKGRTFYYNKIAEFQDSLEEEARNKVRIGNHVRSFFIHNGVFMQSGMQLG